MKISVKEISDFYNAHPECIGKIYANTRFGKKIIEYADITAYDSSVMTITLSSGKSISCSPEHLLWSENSWIKAQDLSINTNILTIDGYENITQVCLEPHKMDLYDLQIEDVKEFYANDIVSHNSTILDALCFALFGKAFRNINKPKLVNSVNGKDCLVEIEFTTNGKNYLVRRGIKPNIFEIYCNDILLNQDSASKDYQEHLEKFILKMSYKSFTQIVILGSASFTPFMQLSPADRRTIIENLLDIEIFSVMSIVAKNKLQSNKENLEKNRLELVGKEEKKTFIEKTISSLKQNNEEKIEQYQKEIFGYENELEKLKSKITSLEKIREDLLDKTSNISFKEKHKKLISLQSKIETNLKRHEKDVSFYETNDDCPTCRQAIDKEFKNQILTNTKTKVDELKEGFSSITREIDICIEQIDNIEKLITKSNNIKTEIASYKVRQSSLISMINNIQDEIEKIKNSDNMLITNETELNIVTEELEELKKTKEELLNNRLFIDTAINLLKDGGIKTKIIKQYLPIINKQINKYLSQMGFFAHFEINEQFEEKIKSRYLDEFSYENFSEGEKMRVDLAILFTWRAIAKMKNSVNTNLLVLDEIFDSSLDVNGTDEFLKIMWNLVDGTNVFVISHKSSMIDKFQKIYEFQKIKNFSRLSNNS